MQLKKNFFFPFLFRAAPAAHEVPRLGVESELQLLSYTAATAMQDPSRVIDLHHSSEQRQILNPLSEAWDGTCIFMDTSLIVSTAPQRELLEYSSKAAP